MKKLPPFLAFALAFALAPQTVFAQAPAPSSAEPSRVQQHIAPLGEPTLTTGGGGGLTGSQSYVDAPAGAEKVTFVLKSVAVQNATVYSDAEIASTYDNMLGQEITLADVYAIANKLTVKYRNDGYILTQVVVPEQTIAGGNIRLRVVEGFVGNVTIKGDMSDSPFLQAYGAKISSRQPLNARTLERYLLLINDLPGVSARAVLSPSQTAGASDVTVIIEKKPYDLFAQVDNRGSRYLGPFQFNTGVRFNDAFGLGGALNFQVATAPDGWPQREMDFGGVTWIQPLNHEGTQASLGTSITSTEPGYTLEPFDVKGLARNVNFELSHPFIRSRSVNLIGALKLDYLNSTRRDNVSGKIEDRLRVARLGGTGQFTDSLLGLNTLSIEGSQGIDLLNASTRGSGSLTRADGNPTFSKVTFDASRLQRISDIFEGFLAVTGQKSAHTLLASEEFGVGGVEFGSAYDSSEITGEDGIAGRFELRANDPVPTGFDMFQGYGFYDIGMVRDRDNAVTKDKHRSLASTGAGLRADFNETLSGSFEVAVPLTRPVSTTGDNGPRFFTSITGRF